MDSTCLPTTEHLCYVRCNYCSTLLAVGIPCKRLMETISVKCGHCNSLSFLNARPVVVHTHLPDVQMSLGLQGNSCADPKNAGCGQSSSSSSMPVRDLSPKTHHHVVKPPERKHRVPSAYNRFMKDEIKRIKAAQPNIHHRDAFSKAAKSEINSSSGFTRR